MLHGTNVESRVMSHGNKRAVSEVLWWCNCLSIRSNKVTSRAFISKGGPSGLARGTGMDPKK